MPAVPPVARIALLWFFTLGGLGMFFPFFSLYLYKDAGLTGAQVGIVLATVPLVGIVAQPAWGQIADLTGRRTRVLSIVLCGGSLGYLLLGLPDTFGEFIAAATLIALFSTSLMPSLWSVSLALVGAGGPRVLGWVRAIGTVGFGVSVGTFPYLAAWLDPEAAGQGTDALPLIFPLASSLVAVATLLALTLPKTGEVSVRAARGDYRKLLSHGPFVRLLVAAFFAVLCIRGPNAMLPILVHAHGGSIRVISKMWLLMLSLEVPLIAAFGISVRRLSLRGIVMIGVVASAVRWLVSGYTTDLSVMTAAQVLHGVGVWGVIVCIPNYVDAVVPTSLRSTAQAALAMVAFGIGGVISSTLAGWLMDALGPRSPAQLGGTGALLLAVSLYWLLPQP